MSSQQVISKVFVMTTTPNNTSNQSAFLYYWKIYWDDYDEGHRPLSRLNQNSPTMQLIRPGDVVWAFTRRKTDEAYVLVARFLVSQVGENDDGNPAGQWYFASNSGNFRYLDPQTQEDAGPVIRGLGIKADADVLGKSFRGRNAVRQISIEALQALDQHAGYQADPLNNTDSVSDDTYEDLDIDQSLLGSDGAPRFEFKKSGVKRDPAVRRQVIRRAANGCERSSCADDRRYSGFLDVHHILGAEKSDRIWTCVSLCPNCHRAAHYAPDRDALNAEMLEFASKFRPATHR